MSMPVQMLQAQDGERPQTDDQILDLADDLKEAQDHTQVMLRNKLISVGDGVLPGQSTVILPHLKARTPPISIGSKRGRSSSRTSEVKLFMRWQRAELAGAGKMSQEIDGTAARLRTLVRGILGKYRLFVS
ncbi:hypothetical protein Tco_0396212 [Tanacetum coccineum]